MCLYNNYEGNCNMKRKRIVFGTLIGALALSVGALVGVNANNKAVENKAAAIPGGQLYVQVRNASELRIGDTVMFGSGERIFTYLAGNPIFSCGEAIDGHNEDYTKYYFASSDAIPWKVEQGIASGTYSFKSIKDKNLEKNYSHPTNGRYLAYGHNYSGPGYSNIQAYGDVNTSGSKNENSSWTVKFSDDGLAHVQRYGEPLQWQEGGEPGSFTEIQYIYYGSSARNNFGYYQNTSNFRIYRKVDFSKGVSIDVINSNNKSYKFGQKSDLTGLEITVDLDDGFIYTCTYENEPGFFEALPVSMFTGARFSWCGYESCYPAEVTHDTSNERRYSKSDEKFADPRGDYVLAFDVNDPDEEIEQIKNVTRVMNFGSLNGTPGAATYQSLWEIENPIIDTNYPLNEDPQKRPAVVNNIVQIVLIDNGDEDVYNDYYIKKGDNYLFNNDGGYLTLEPRTGDYSHDQRASVSLDANNNIRFGSGMGILAFDKTNRRIVVAEAYPELDTDKYIPIDAYRLQLTDNLGLVESFGNFLDTFFANTADYDPTGQHDDVTSSNWAAIRNAYNGLDLNLKGFLGCLTYTHNHTDGGSVYRLADVYDSLLYIHNGEDGFDDFMDRSRAMTLQDRRYINSHGTNCTIDGYSSIYFNAEYHGTIDADSGYQLPEFIEILMGGVHLDESFYTYERNNAKTQASLTINARVIVDNVVINVVAVPAKYTVTYISGEGYGQDYVTSNYQEHISQFLDSITLDSSRQQENVSSVGKPVVFNTSQVMIMLLMVM